jgi:hypothetical protein
MISKEAAAISNKEYKRISLNGKSPKLQTKGAADAAATMTQARTPWYLST